MYSPRRKTMPDTGFLNRWTATPKVWPPARFSSQLFKLIMLPEMARRLGTERVSRWYGTDANIRMYGRSAYLELQLLVLERRRGHVPGCAQGARALKQRVWQITRRNGGSSLQTVVAKLSKYLPVWKEYFQLVDTPKGFADCDKWIRHRLRALQFKQWKRGPKVYAEMRRLGLSKQVAAKGRGGPPTLVISCRQVGSGRTHHRLSGRRWRACALATVRRSICTCGFPACSFHEDC
jgi:hypothetical protein